MSEQNQKPNNPEPNKPPTEQNSFRRSLIIIGFGILSVIILLVTQRLVRGDNFGQPEITFNEYQRLLELNIIVEVTITPGDAGSAVLSGKTAREENIEFLDGRVRKLDRFQTILPNFTSEDANILAQKGIRITMGKLGIDWFSVMMNTLPWVLLIGVYIFFMRRMQSAANPKDKNVFNFGKSKAKMQLEGEPKVTFIDVAGCDEAKVELTEIVEFLKEPEKFQRLGGKIPKGVLLLGPPGTGKTLLARAVAGEAGVPFFSLSGADFVEMFVGVGASRVRDIFDQGKKNSPCIIFIDELDAVGRQRGAGFGGGHDEREQTLNALLVEMDGFDERTNVILIAATNRPDILDTALLRPGRFDRQIVVDRPDVRGREGILRVHTRKTPLAKDVDIALLAKVTPGMSGADLANLVNEAALLAARDNADEITMLHFDKAKDKIITGVERKNMVMSDKEKRNTAYHEAGHAIVAKYLPNADPVHKVTIIPRGRALGVTTYLPTEDKYSYSRADLLARITYMLGGRIAEKVIFKDYSTGASNDIQQATDMAKRMICEFGMSDLLGPVSYGSKNEEVFLGRDYGRVANYSEKTAIEIDNEVKRIITTCENDAERILTENIGVLHEVSELLLKNETITGEEIDTIMNSHKEKPAK